MQNECCDTCDFLVVNGDDKACYHPLAKRTNPTYFIGPVSMDREGKCVPPYFQLWTKRTARVDGPVWGGTAFARYDEPK